jgi:tetratricopeptide (TPR) repeat protein
VKHLARINITFIAICFLTVFFSASPLFANGIREEIKSGQVMRDAEIYYNRGLEHLENGEYDLSIEAFSQAILLNPNNAEYYNYRGNAYYYKNEVNRALKTIRLQF